MSGERAASSEGEAGLPARRRAPHWGRAVLIGLVAVLAALAALVTYLYVGAPGLVRTEVLKVVAQRYHRTARLDRVRLDPLRLSADVWGFSLPDRDGRPMIAFRHLHAGLSWPSLLLGRIVFDDLSLDAPRLRLVRRADGKLNLADLTPPPSKSSGKPLTLRIARFQIADGQVEAIDAARPTPFEKRFDRISFDIRNFTTTSDGASYSLAAETRAGERLSWRGAFGIAPLASSGRFEFANWRVGRLAAIAGDALPFTISSGTLNVDGDYDASLRGQKLGLTLDISQASVQAPAIRPKSGAATDPVRAEALAVSGVHIDLARRTVNVAHIVVTRPDVVALRDANGAVNLAALAPRSAGSSAPPSGPSWTVSAPDIRIVDGSASFTDRSQHAPAAWTIDPVNLTVTGLAYPFATPLQVSLNARANDGSTLAATGSLALPERAGQTPSGRFEVALRGLELRRFQPYISEAARVSITRGAASAKGRLDLTTAGAARFSGMAQIDNLRVIDPMLKSSLVTWNRVTATGVEASSKPFDVKVARIRANAAYGRVVLEPNYQINIRAVLEEPGASPGVAALDIKPAIVAKAPPPTPTKAINLPIDIARIDFVNSRMDFTDLTVEPHFYAGIEGLNGSITNFSARANAHASVDLKGDVGPYAPVVIAGSLDPFAADRFVDMRMQFHNMELTTFSPYSGKFAGYQIDRGKLDLDLRYHIVDERLNASHHVVINQLQLGKQVDSPNATKLPVKLIIALLEDRNGVIDLPIDVSGSLNDPTFQYWPVIWKVIGNVLGKIAAAPFTLLGDLVGHGGAQDLSRVDFQPGASALTPDDTSRLMALARALDQRPGLNLNIPETVAPGVDGPALAQAAYQDALQRTYDTTFKHADQPGLTQALATPKLKLKLLDTLYRRVFGQAPPRLVRAAGKDGNAATAASLETALRAHFAASNHALDALAQARAQAVEATLVQTGHVDPRRIFLVAAPPLKTAPIVMTVALR